MKFKVDKEFLLKHRFWIMLCVVPLLWLMAWMVLSTSVAGERDAKRESFDKLLKSLGSISNPINDRFIDPLKDKEKRLKDHKEKVWADVWRSQEDIMTWPFSERTTPDLMLFHYASRPEAERPSRIKDMLAIRRAEGRPSGYFGDDVPDPERRDYATSLYQSQLKEFEQPPSPVYFLGGWRNIIQPVEKWTNTPPTTEECWLAQEDLWVKRELLRAIKSSLDSVARFDDANQFMLVEHTGKDGAVLSKDASVRQVSRNPSLELELILELKDPKDLEKPEDPAGEPKEPEKKPEDAKKPPVVALGVKSRIKNINVEKKSLPLDGLTLRLSQPGAEGKPPHTAELTFTSQPLEAGKSLEIGKPVVLPQFNGKEPIEVRLIEDKGDPLPKGILARQRLRNPNWELELLLEQVDLSGRKELVISSKSKIKNVHPHYRTQNLNGVTFMIKQQDQTPVTLKVQDEPLAWSKSVDIGKPHPVTTFSTDLRARPLSVEQVLDWMTTPIKRIDEIRLGYHSHRTMPVDGKLTSKKFGDTPAAAPTAPAPSSQPGLPPLEGEGRVAAAGSKTPNGIERERYLEVTGQVRRLPIGMVVVVDQAHIQDMLTAFSNSRLRIQPTQVHWKRIAGVRPYSADEQVDPKKPDDPKRPPVGPRPIGVKPGSKTPFGEEGKFPGVGPGPGAVSGPEGAAGGSSDDPNLVQLSIYGISSLYERYPPKSPGGSEASK